MEKLIVAICISIISFFFIINYIFPERIDDISSMVFYKFDFFKDLRIDYNQFSDRMEFVKNINENQLESIENTFFSPIYKKEYEELITLYKMNDEFHLTNNFSIGILLNTTGNNHSEILKIKSDKIISPKGYVVSPVLSTVVGKIIKSYGNIADVAPIWSDQFSSQVYVISENEIDEINNDLALIEKRMLINFNPALPYETGDEIRISETEFGGYELKRYNLNEIGRVSNIKNSEIVEKYEIDYNFSREALLNNRYFFIIENKK